MPLPTESLTPRSAPGEIRRAIEAAISQCVEEGGGDHDRCKDIAYETARRATRRVGLPARIVRKVLRRVRGSRRSWDAKWSQDGFSPDWAAKSIPQEVMDAVESGWFPPGATILDVGCGSGEIAAWLAQHRFDVLGIDFSGAAIEAARAKHVEAQGRLAFEVMDICAGHPASARFSAVLDRGCFHGVPDQSSYARNIASWTLPEARMLLFANAWKSTREQRIREVESAFHSVFEISKTASTYVGKHPGVAIWMVRR